MMAGRRWLVVVLAVVLLGALVFESDAVAGDGFPGGLPPDLFIVHDEAVEFRFGFLNPEVLRAIMERRLAAIGGLQELRLYLSLPHTDELIDAETGEPVGPDERASALRRVHTLYDEVSPAGRPPAAVREQLDQVLLRWPACLEIDVDPRSWTYLGPLIHEEDFQAAREAMNARDVRVAVLVQEDEPHHITTRMLGAMDADVREEWAALVDHVLGGTGYWEDQERAGHWFDVTWQDAAGARSAGRSRASRRLCAVSTRHRPG